MNKAHRDLLRENYEAAVHEYCNAFAYKHEYYYSRNEWVAGKVGGVVFMCDLFIDFDDIKYDIDADLPENMYIQYYDYMLQIAMIDDMEHTALKRVNYENFSRGVRPYSDEQLEQIKAAKQRADRTREELVELCEQMRQKGAMNEKGL